MIRFNLELLTRASKGTPTKFLQEFEKMCLTGKSTGPSYILDPHNLLRSKVELLYKVHYIQLAAKRIYTDYKVFKDAGLYIHPYNIDLQTLKFNPLVTLIDNCKLLFLFEERYKKWHH